MNHLTTEPIDIDALATRVARPSDGAVVTFAGVVRNHHDGKSVESIDYQAYASMAEKEISRVVATVAAEHPEVALSLVHRLGLLRVGETSIAIVCASAHRAAAFEACRKLIDRVKETVPIWKKERGPDGEAWVGWQGTRTDPVPGESEN